MTHSGRPGRSLWIKDCRLLDIATPANRDFVDERLGKILIRKQELEPRLADLQRVDFKPVDLEAATRDALAYPRDSVKSWARSPSTNCPFRL